MTVLTGGGIEARIDYKKDKDGKPITMWRLIEEKKIPPTRIARYCCQVLKETATQNRMAVVGVRASESTKRQGRDSFGTRGGAHTTRLCFFRLTIRRRCIARQKIATPYGIAH